MCDDGRAMGEIIKVDQLHPAKEVLALAANVARNRGVLVMPTDSVYGIGCAAYAQTPALPRIFRIKNRPLNQTLPFLIADLDDLYNLGHDLPHWASSLAEVFWPGALTLVVRASDNISSEYLRPGAFSTIALRLPDSELVRELARLIGVPLATTSANTHGAPSATSAARLEPSLIEAADLTMDAGPAPIAVASTIVDCTEQRPRILREGAIAKERVFRVAGD